MNIIGTNIRLLRQKNGWSQGEVARLLKISIPAFSKIETGVTDINISRLDQISKLFDVSSLEIISRGENKLEMGNFVEISMLKDKLALKEQEITKLQKKIIDLYEEIRTISPSKNLSQR
ncbi:helix-turn-helix domain-containing protein [Pedobacter boryungensis]|uniref:Helix-turn-helix transcriptional regulator n=1 Tax=Pedobacter boryungensis TaxID=869962 RepID=A0ABX2DDV2_9SPHI|nr:helix-turn-helix domain-containing protein [Pedobacter boryungensis]NQX31151.1 helix-turn-helix transcriptional regulator [Pedobacter boryungensis]